MNVHEAARQLHYSERHVKRLAKEGKLPSRKVKAIRAITVEEYEFPDDLLQRMSYEPYVTRKG